ncbi:MULTISPECIES: PTS sugar transporter subunit IIA [Megamonas]|jgi:PTS system N-acetylgalactosamine-specific IIA component|uniref:EIIAB-Man n=2 Tax=Megamonas TaxID=158846 RepID=A0A378NUB8_9FIRM|nr:MULTISPECIES: PTS fructose transporter subunit IIA [Megamonas]MBE5059570.1 PTS fructose transporter subunit IIA [Megamonas funiformis]MBM6748204.1 PTS fructose transporter subunit IIA [Megamonas rupellensis]NJE28691.1 PTS fructose transporter subunit IIA [Megamonas funiformis]RGQ02293.1 PTS fructose transporter subunit IIA [Megamonas rupellensis]STY71950.1 EIIAB-Man [Megamonas hypermegale]
MKYVILVSHGKFANGLNDALSMLAGNREDILSVGLENGKSVDEFAALFTEKVKDISTDDEVILLGDIIGGSPLTNATNVLVNKGIKTVILGGMNLPLALTTVLMKDTVSLDEIADQVLEQARMAMQEFKIVEESEDDI